MCDCFYSTKMYLARDASNHPHPYDNPSSRTESLFLGIKVINRVLWRFYGRLVIVLSNYTLKLVIKKLLSLFPRPKMHLKSIIHKGVGF